MKIGDRRIAYQGKYLRLVNKEFRTVRGREGTWEVIERTNVYGSGGVVIIPLTRDRELILEKNFRVPVESWVIQFPAGLTDKIGESEEDAARRELLEETGYRAGELIRIKANTPLAPTLTSTMGTHFLARDVEFVGMVNDDANEEIEVLKVPLADIGSFLLGQPDDVMLDLRVPGILWLLEKKGML